LETQLELLRVRWDRREWVLFATALHKLGVHLGYS
jgi:hypothetical protein